MSTELKLGNVYYFQIVGQTKVANYSLENLLSCLVGERPMPWNLIFRQAEFANHNMEHKFTSNSLFEIAFGNPISVFRDISYSSLWTYKCKC